MIEEELIDGVTGEVRIPHRLADQVEVRSRVGEGDAGSTAAEIDQDHHALVGQTRRGLQRGQRRGGVGEALDAAGGD